MWLLADEGTGVRRCGRDETGAACGHHSFSVQIECGLSCMDKLEGCQNGAFANLASCIDLLNVSCAACVSEWERVTDFL